MQRAATRLCPEYTLWAEQQASGTCSAAGQIKALFTALTRAPLGSLAQEVTETTIFPLATSLSSSVTRDYTRLARDITGQPSATE